jgi:hypothetical protein
LKNQNKGGIKMVDLSFLAEINQEKRQGYIMTLRQIIEIHRRGINQWRFTPIGMIKERILPVVHAPAGYINKLEREGIIKRVYSSNTRTIYTLAYPYEVVERELQNYL